MSGKRGYVLKKSEQKRIAAPVFAGAVGGRTDMDKITMVHRDSLSCEAIVRKLEDGSLFLISQCGGNSEPAPENREYVFRSADGEKWSAPELLQKDNGRAMYATDVDVDKNKITVWLTEHNGRFLDADCYALVSTDGVSWQRREIPHFGNSFTFIRGTIPAGKDRLAAYQHYPVTQEENASLNKSGKTILDSALPAVQCGTLLFSPDGTYKKSKDLLLPNEFGGKRVWQWPEPTLARLKEGYVMLLRVNGAGVLYRSDSADGLHWCRPYPTDIPNPNNKPKLLNLKGGAIALINTPNGKVGFRYRNPLEIWISDDDMRSWRYKKRVLDFPGWLSYPDGFADGERIVFAFEVNRS